jgi:hypothetical protein
MPTAMSLPSFGSARSRGYKQANRGVNLAGPRPAGNRWLEDPRDAGGPFLEDLLDHRPAESVVYL